MALLASHSGYVLVDILSLVICRHGTYKKDEKLLMPHAIARRFHLPDPAEHLKKMLEQLVDNDLMFVGIDPGMSGAIAFLPPRKFDPFMVDIPTLTHEVKTTKKGKQVKGKRSTYDYSAIAALLDPLIDNSHKVIIALERGQPRWQDTPKTAFSIAMGYGMWQLYFTAFGLSWDEYMPAVWKRKMKLPGGDNKDASRTLAKRLFPKAGKFLTCVGDHDRAEALILAAFSQRERAGGFSV